MWEFFDSIVYLNQEERKDRLLDCQSELSRVGITADPFYSIKAEQPYLSFCLSQKAMLSSLLQKKGNKFLALEDDVKFQNLDHLAEALSELPQDWDMVYLGANVTDEKPERYSNHLRRIRSAWTTHAVAYTRKAIEEIVEKYNSWEANGMFDDWLSREFLPKHNCYIVAPMVAWQRPVFSDLWGNHVSYGWSEIETKLK